MDLNIDQLPSPIRAGNDDQNKLGGLETYDYKELLAVQRMDILALHNSHFPISLCLRIFSPIKVIEAQCKDETFITIGCDVLYPVNELCYFLYMNERR